MRFFRGSQDQFDQLRESVMDQLAMPNSRADEPWPPGVTVLALAPHHYEPEEYAAMIHHALESGITEITMEEYMASHSSLNSF